MIMVFGFLVSFGFGQYCSERGERVPLSLYIAVHFSTEERACIFVAVLHFHFMTLFVTAFYDCILQTLGKGTRFHRRESKVLLLLLLLLHSGAAFHHVLNAHGHWPVSWPVATGHESFRFPCQCRVKITTSAIPIHMNMRSTNFVWIKHISYPHTRSFVSILRFRCLDTQNSVKRPEKWLKKKNSNCARGWARTRVCAYLFN